MSTPLPTPQRFDPSQYVITAGSSLSIPLHILPLTGINPAPPTPNVLPGNDTAAADVGKNNDGGGSGGYKIGIMLAIAASGGSATPKMFEFDTGGQGFWVDPTDTLPVPPASECTITITYTSGMVYQAVPTPATITFAETGSPNVAPLSVNAVVGMIGSVAGPQVFPIFKNFWGDFGCALQGFTNQGAANYTPSLLTALAQLPAPYNTGFIVDVGPYPGDPAPKEIPPGQLIVGLTDQLRALFPNTVKMTPGIPYDSIATYLENVINGNLTIVSNSDAASPANTANGIGVVFDTGAPTTVVHFGKEVSFGPQPGDSLQLVPSADANQYALLAFQVGTESGSNAAGASQKNVLNLRAGYINTGLNAFFAYPVMFDLQKGLIGFPATS